MKKYKSETYKITERTDKYGKPAGQSTSHYWHRGQSNWFRFNSIFNSVVIILFAVVIMRFFIGPSDFSVASLMDSLGNWTPTIPAISAIWTNANNADFGDGLIGIYLKGTTYIQAVLTTIFTIVYDSIRFLVNVFAIVFGM